MIKFVTITQDVYYRVNDVCAELCCLNNKKGCGQKNCNGGYFVNVKPTRKRKSRDRRLLDALLKQCNIISNDVWTEHTKGKMVLSDTNRKQFIAIKEVMRKGGGK